MGRSQPTALGGETYERILAKLVTLEILPGERLTVDALARELGVSQTPVREALSMLESDGLVRKAHMRGFFATPSLTRDDLVSLYEFRLLIEPAAAGMAALKRTDGQLEQMRDLSNHMEDRGSAGPEHSDYSRFASLDAELHSTIAQVSGNKHIHDGLVRLRTHVHIFRLMHDSKIAVEAIEEHRIIVRAIEASDPHLAEAAMRSHVERSRDRLLRAFD